MREASISKWCGCRGRCHVRGDYGMRSPVHVNRNGWLTCRSRMHRHDMMTTTGSKPPSDAKQHDGRKIQIAKLTMVALLLNIMKG